MNYEKATYSVPELAEILGISLPTAYKLVRSAGFPKLPIGKRVLIPIIAFEEWLKNPNNYRELNVL